MEKNTSENLSRNLVMSQPLRVYIDFEFSDFLHRDIISIGAVTDSGETFYRENSDEYDTHASEWVRANVYPLLQPEHACSLNELEARLWCWFDELNCDQIQIVSDYKGDYELLLGLLSEKHPKFTNEPIFLYDAFVASCLSKGWIDEDFETIFCLRECKDFYYSEFMGWFLENGVAQHHALNDAQAIKYAFELTINKFNYLQVLRKSNV
jgi:hypothetical protein